MKMSQIINLENEIKKIDKPWSPIEIARVNDQVVRMALIKGEFHWHKHTDADELFYAYKGNITIQLKGQPDIALHEGEMVVIPKGVEHCPKSEESAYNLLFEPSSLQTRGN